jgi:hypothetical protein
MATSNETRMIAYQGAALLDMPSLQDARLQLADKWYTAGRVASIDWSPRQSRMLAHRADLEGHVSEECRDFPLRMMRRLRD